MAKNQHVVPRGNGWAVRGEGNKKDTAHTDNKKPAEDIARDIARNQGGEVVIHGRNGRIQDKDSYGNDPNPPKDNKH